MNTRIDTDLVALPIASPAIITWTAPGFEESDGADYELTAHIDRDFGNVERVVTSEGDEVEVDLDIERLIEQARDRLDEEAAVARAGF